MSQLGGKDSKRHFTVVMGGKEHGLYVSSSPSSAAKKAVTKLCTANKSKKVEFYIREITQGSKKKTYGPYEGHIDKLKEPIELKGRVIKYKPVAKLSKKQGVKKGGNGSDSINQPSFNNLNKLNSAIPFNGDYIFPPANELTFRQKRRQEGYRKAHGPLTNAEKEKKAAANALYLAKIEAASAQREKEEQNKKKRLLEKLAEKLVKDKKISRFKYFSHDLTNIQFPPFYLLVGSPNSRFELQYFLTFINNEYIAFHIKNIGTIENKGDIFAGPTDDFEEFARDVNNYFSEPNNNMRSKKIHLQKVDEKIYPTYKIENISGYHKNP
jgi:hypothetical protein